MGLYTHGLNILQHFAIKVLIDESFLFCYTPMRVLLLALGHVGRALVFIFIFFTTVVHNLDLGIRNFLFA